MVWNAATALRRTCFRTSGCSTLIPEGRMGAIASRTASTSASTIVNTSI
jgi:hypothetical protein